MNRSLVDLGTSCTEQLSERNRPIIASFNLPERILYWLSKDPEKVFRQGYESGVSGEWNEDNALSGLRSRFPNFDGMVRGKRVLDYGCGDGFQSIAIAKLGASDVLGIDIVEPRLQHAQRLANGVPNVRFATTAGADTFDVVISQNAFEHLPDPAKSLADMAASLRPRGRVLITFGPPWLAPYGSHMHFFTRCPWVNILFAEATVFRVRTLYRNDGLLSYFPELNKMTIKMFENLIYESGLTCEWKFYHAVKRLPFVVAVPGLRELFISNVTCVLVVN